MRVLIGCETSGVMRSAFAALGHDVWSCDLLPAEDRSNRHMVGDVRDFLDDGWDLLVVCHPPCTRLCNSGVRWLHEPPTKLGHTYAAEDRSAYALWSRDERLEFMWRELPEGLVARADDKTVYLNRTEMTVPSALWTMVSAGAPIGLVAMDLTSARRFRINGSVNEVTPERVTIDVAQTCPNCPKYIQQRLPVADNRYQGVSPASGSDLPDNLADLIRQADTFFVASKNPDGDHDASHRGGYPGFVNVKGNQLIVPDYFGNSMFMTLGNLALEPRAGITFVDFDTGAQLNLTGHATLNLEGRMAHDGADGRYWTFDIEAWQLTPHRPEPAWKLGAYSRFNPPLET